MNTCRAVFEAHRDAIDALWGTFQQGQGTHRAFVTQAQTLADDIHQTLTETLAKPPARSIEALAQALQAAERFDVPRTVGHLAHALDVAENAAPIGQDNHNGP